MQDSTELSHITNNYFASIGPKFPLNLPSSNQHFTDWKIIAIPTLFIDTILSAETETEILFIPVNKTCVLYLCSNRILRCSTQIVSRSVAELMNISIQTGIYHSKFKYAKIKPIYKNEDETDPSNYRPIFLLSNFNQIFEKLI